MHSTDAELVSKSLIMSALTLCLVLAASVTSVICYSDHVSYDISKQSRCTEVTRQATRNCIWSAGINSFVDQIAEGGRIIAYKIQWSNGDWSGWYVPGVNDLEWKFNPSGRKCSTLLYPIRRMWSYFYDYTHKFIICKSK